MEPAQSSVSERDRLLKARRDALAQCEQREIEFRRRDRMQRAAELRLPLSEASRQSPS